MNIQGRSISEEAALPLARYLSDGYFARSQMDTLVSQILEVKFLRPSSVLEIGVGNGFVSSFLKVSGMHVTTFDINQNLRPDVVGNILEIDNYFEANCFELILCAEVLEHLPFHHFEEVMRKLATISSKYVVLTLPRSHRILLDLSINIKIPFIPRLETAIFWRIPTSRISSDHHWQIDASVKWRLMKIKKILRKYFIISNDYAEKRNRPHQFFILRKI